MPKMIVFADLDREWAKPFLEKALTDVGYEVRYHFDPLSTVLDRLGDRCQDVEILSPFIASAVN